jgi:hypothetical protein
VLDVCANFFIKMALIRLDLPTLDLPIKDISGKTTFGYCLGCVALNKKFVCFLK